MIPTKTVEELILKHSNLEKDLSSGEIDKKLFAEKSKEYSDVNEIIECAKKYISFDNDKKELDKILEDSSADDELKKMAELELKELQSQHEINEKKLKLFLLPKDEADKKNAIIEIRAGTGGLEASLFASDLFKMYEKVSHKKKWLLELISISRSDAGGLKEVIASIKGKNIYSTLKYESGVHRVQRVPDTETQGRVHTSAATVAVLPEAEEVDLKINDSDLRIDVFRAGGPGGQSVNTTDSAVRITHIPTGLSVSQQDEKSQHKNKAKGMKILRSRLYELERSRIDQERSQDRKTKIGTGDRSERIRTYNFPQGRVHTSAATVAVLPEAEEIDLKIDEGDLRIDVFRAGGPGGQSVNTTDSAVRITHIPTGLSVSQQDEKSQHKNKAKGMKILRARIYELERSRIDQERSEDRKNKIGSGDRSERIRTYNFPQGRVTDHRINLTLHKLQEFLEGEAFDEIIENLTLQAQEESLSKL